MKLKSYAKINLGLKVYKNKGKQKKHEIDSIFYLVTNLYDDVTINRSNRPTVTYYYKGNKLEIDDCLVLRALAYLQKKHNLDVNYDIVIDKNIPMSSGLGSASSNAACVINYILSRNKPVYLDLKDIALNLGSDIPFFLTQYPIARVKRYGEFVSPLTNIKPRISLLLTKIECSTKHIFDLLDQDQKYVSQVDIDAIYYLLINKQHQDVVYNDLTKYIIESNKKLQDIVNNNPGVFFTGSGGTLVRIEEEKYEN